VTNSSATHQRRPVAAMLVGFTLFGAIVGLPPSAQAEPLRAGLVIEVVLHSHFTQTSEMKCVGWGPYAEINDGSDLLVYFGEAAADVANKVGGGMNPDEKSCALFYGMQAPLVEDYYLQFISPQTDLSKKYGPFRSALLIDSSVPRGTRQLIADLR
jgi:hypothetical protein